MNLMIPGRTTVIMKLKATGTLKEFEQGVPVQRESQPIFVCIDCGHRTEDVADMCAHQNNHPKLSLCKRLRRWCALHRL